MKLIIWLEDSYMSVWVFLLKIWTFWQLFQTEILCWLIICSILSNIWKTMKSKGSLLIGWKNTPRGVWANQKRAFNFWTSSVCFADTDLQTDWHSRADPGERARFTKAIWFCNFCFYALVNIFSLARNESQSRPLTNFASVFSALTSIQRKLMQNYTFGVLVGALVPKKETF